AHICFRQISPHLLHFHPYYLPASVQHNTRPRATPPRSCRDIHGVASALRYRILFLQTAPLASCSHNAALLLYLLRCDYIWVFQNYCTHFPFSPCAFCRTAHFCRNHLISLLLLP
ncbi:unnamed protein product, partial [Sphacelaria rigidula]